MNTQEMLEVLKLLSSLESWSFAVKQPLPDYLFERLDNTINLMTCRVLDAPQPRSYEMVAITSLDNLNVS